MNGKDIQRNMARINKITARRTKLHRELAETMIANISDIAIIEYWPARYLMIDLREQKDVTPPFMSTLLGCGSWCNKRGKKFYVKYLNGLIEDQNRNVILNKL